MYKGRIGQSRNIEFFLQKALDNRRKKSSINKDIVMGVWAREI